MEYIKKMKYIIFFSLSAILLIGGIILAILKISGWGWLIFLGVLVAPDFKIKFNDENQN